MHGTNWTTTYTTADGLASNTVFAIAEDSQGNLWFGTDAGVSRFDGTDWTTYTTSDGLVENHVLAVATDYKGNLWFGTLGEGVSKFDGTDWTTYTVSDGLASNYVGVIAEDSQGNLWFGTVSSGNIGAKGISKLAAPPVTLACQSISAAPGSTVGIPITLDSPIATAGGGQFLIHATPSSYATFNSAFMAGGHYYWTVSDNPSGNGQLLLFYSGSGKTIAAGKGEILTVYYEISPSAPDGAKITLSLSRARIADKHGKSLRVTVVSGRIAISSNILPGDVNADGTVDILDVVLIVKFALGKQTYTTQQKVGADINADGSINILDVIAAVDLALGKETVQLAATADYDQYKVNLRQLKMNLEALGADPELIDDVAGLYLRQFAEPSLPKSFSLAQNAPNPFNPSTTIKYDIPEGNPVQVSLLIYNLRGQLVKALVDETREPGSYSVFWDGTDETGRRVSSGVYLYRMKAGEFTQTRKMVILK